MRAELDVMEYVVINEYGGMLPWTVDETKEGCLKKFCVGGRIPDDLKGLGCAIFKMVPMFVEGCECNRFTKQEHIDFLKKGKVNDVN